MKRPEDYYNSKWKKLFPHIIIDSDFVEEIINSSIKEAQIDAYNEALDDAIDNATALVVVNRVIIDKESILKLKKL